MAAPAAHSPNPGDHAPMSREAIAESLITRRDQLIRQLPRQIRISRALNHDQREWVIDRATDFLVTENKGVIADLDSLEKAFWKAADIRVHRTFEGRYDTVRGRFRRVGLGDDALTDDSASPEDLAVATFERETLEEFAAELTDEERTVLSVKYSGRKELGRFEIARILGRRPHEVRRTERSLLRKLTEFSAIVVAGRLCEARQPSLDALAGGQASQLDQRRAHAHLERCSTCRVEYHELVAAIRSGRLPREIAQILPAPTIDAVQRHRGPWEIVTDWLSRPFGHDAALSAAQLAPAGRGLSALAGAKLLSICLGSAAAVGGYFCMSQFSHDAPPPKRPAATAKPKNVTQAKTKPETRLVKIALVTPTPIQTRTTKRRRATSRRPGGEISNSPTSHEKAAAISPPATTTSGEPLSEFEPGPANTAPARPAAAPVNGGPEFP